MSTFFKLGQRADEKQIAALFHHTHAIKFVAGVPFEPAPIRVPIKDIWAAAQKGEGIPSQDIGPEEVERAIQTYGRTYCPGFSFGVRKF